MNCRRLGVVSRSQCLHQGLTERPHSGKCQPTHHFPLLLLLFTFFFSYLSLFVKHSRPYTHDHPFPASVLYLPSLPPGSPFLLPLVISHSVFHTFKKIFFLSHVLFFTLILPLSGVFSSSPTNSSLPVSCLSSAGSEHFLLGENLTVAVLGVVIPIGKSPEASLSVFVCPYQRPAGLHKPPVYLAML